MQTSEPFFQMHNDFIEVYVASGLIGLLIFVWIISTNICHGLRTWRKNYKWLCALVIYVAYSLFWFPIFIPSIVFVAIISLALLSKDRELSRGN